MLSRSTVLLLCLAVTTGVFTGCGSNKAKLNPVQGQLFVDGVPAAQAIVVFHPVHATGTDDTRPTATVDDQGNFTLTSHVQGDGAPEGEYQVTVTWYRAQRAGADYVSVNRLPERFGQPGGSQLRATVKSGDNQLPAFRIDTRKAN